MKIKVFPSVAAVLALFSSCPGGAFCADDVALPAEKDGFSETEDLIMTGKLENILLNSGLQRLPALFEQVVESDPNVEESLHDVMDQIMPFSSPFEVAMGVFKNPEGMVFIKRLIHTIENPTNALKFPKDIRVALTEVLENIRNTDDLSGQDYSDIKSTLLELLNELNYNHNPTSTNSDDVPFTKEDPTTESNNLSSTGEALLSFLNNFEDVDDEGRAAVNALNKAVEDEEFVEKALDLLDSVANADIGGESFKEGTHDDSISLDGSFYEDGDNIRSRDTFKEFVKQITESDIPVARL